MKRRHDTVFKSSLRSIVNIIANTDKIVSLYEQGKSSHLQSVGLLCPRTVRGETLGSP